MGIPLKFLSFGNILKFKVEIQGIEMSFSVKRAFWYVLFIPSC